MHCVHANAVRRYCSANDHLFFIVAVQMKRFWRKLHLQQNRMHTFTLNTCAMLTMSENCWFSNAFFSIVWKTQWLELEIVYEAGDCRHKLIVVGEFEQISARNSNVITKKIIIICWEQDALGPAREYAWWKLSIRPLVLITYGFRLICRFVCVHLMSVIK